MEREQFLYTARSKTKQKVKVMAAYAEGKAIQYRQKNSSSHKWLDVDAPIWDWSSLDYRVKPEPWRVDCGGTYYYVDNDATIESDVDNYTYIDTDRYNIGNYFSTEEEAKPYLEKFKTLFLKHKEEWQKKNYNIEQVSKLHIWRGQPIQVRYRNEFNPKWIDTPTPGFDWEYYDYRIKPVTWRAAKNKESYWFITSSGGCHLYKRCSFLRG